MKEKGFTLAELLVIISIIAIFSAIAVSNFPQVKLQFALSRVSYKFAQDVRKAQDKALASVQYKDSSGQVKLISGYGVFADISVLGNKKYMIYADYADVLQPGNQQYDGADYPVETIDFSLSEPGVIIKAINSVSGNRASVNFNSSNTNTAITQLNLNQNSVDFVFAMESDQTKIKIVSVNTSGLIEVR